MQLRPRAAVWAAIVAIVAVGAAACGGAGTGGSGADGATGTTRIPSKVTVAGDSISIGVGAQLRGAVGPDAVVKVIGEEGTGLARPDAFDWPGRLETLARDFPPRVLVFSVGSNDAQDLEDANGVVVARFADKAAWDAEYSRRLGRSFDAFAATGTTVVWLGHVYTAEDRVGATNRRVHQLAVALAASRPWVQIEDLAALLGSGEKKATTCLKDDGLHLTIECLDRAAKALAPTMPR